MLFFNFSLSIFRRWILMCVDGDGYKMFMVLWLLLGLRNTTLKTEAKPHDLFICLYSSLSPSLCNSGENIKAILIITESQKRAYIHIVGLFKTNAFFAWGNMYVSVFVTYTSNERILCSLKWWTKIIISNSDPRPIAHLLFSTVGIQFLFKFLLQMKRAFAVLIMFLMLHC